MRPPSSLRKPRVSDTTPNRAFLRGFPATHFPDFGLCERSPILVAIFGGPSPHPKIPFPAAGLEKIPSVEKGWPAAQRLRWFRTFAMNVSQIYDGEAMEPVEIKIDLEEAAN